jgi:hypothetical protein
MMPKLTEPQRALLYDIYIGYCKSCASYYKPAVKLVGHGLIVLESRKLTYDRPVLTESGYELCVKLFGERTQP